MRSARRAAFLAAVFCALGELAFAQQRGGGPFQKGGQSIGLASGYGWGIGKYGSRDTPNADVRIVPILASWRVALTGPLPVPWLRGNVELEAEPQLLVNTEPKAGWGGGLAINFRYNFLRLDPFVPFVGLGGGVAGLDFDLSQAEPFNFIVQGGVGTHWLLCERVALTLAYRFHHMSNGHIDQPNDGFTSHMVLIGPTLFLN